MPVVSGLQALEEGIRDSEGPSLPAFWAIDWCEQAPGWAHRAGTSHSSMQTINHQFVMATGREEVCRFHTIQMPHKNKCMNGLCHVSPS